MNITNIKNLILYLYRFAFLLTEKNVSNLTYGNPEISGENNEMNKGSNNIPKLLRHSFSLRIFDPSTKRFSLRNNVNNSGLNHSFIFKMQYNRVINRTIEF